ncbi:hydantoinase/oxoprolinase family protein [Mesorhizobium sp. M4B.F.Ca.ET.215.01.1.1]|uniref:hydantoinase/oxoprolinase family protein n=1 Tax=unclassified Mesorhizobium TaxID=325217 RepID=UPI000FCB5E48|nr:MULTISPECIES: hydantoinase/oxoprolinase family protein [unclassified Mesorhizobium]RUW23868.1 hydantoinase/oxoprolinase family protein [Mesorhizobium sp. M4B.F.Ca.ET.013.02.1.1]RVD45417.1 hydantoinase/oxoprolinase family protein [Mesorhizobium sp. M4B.F.Ca.ET.019.03.1.1]TGQ15415.1 hydantoinase/oxoprolinase family protein [Mesorhizobium sp. M4B.F.Ca.ET.215.01.1.1]TGQ48376.1 hydantoinase/oxoprolinase family protein [Mesorhizobium sp. M00.F.Ca.ET.220.01.1.1]TGR11479.1 hydantoinase/oxoprolinase
MDQITTNPIVIGIDAGGTMTDTILVDQDGHFKIGKSATTPRNEAEGFLASAEDAADAWGISLQDLFSGVNVVLYSGTGMLNTLLSRTGRKLGLITTKGLEDMILMGRGLQAWADYSYADRLHAVTHHHPDPLVPRRRTHGVTERIDQFGDVILPLYEHEVHAAAKKLIADEVEAICIMTVFSHVNPAHEKRIAEICREEIAAAGADILVYTSHEVRPVVREQSRLNSVLIEAYATSRGRRQLKGIEDVSKKYGFKYGVQTLLSFGGLTSINHPRLHETMISGPIGGILGAAYVGKLIGNDSLICSDMGGTSFDMGVITRGQTRIENEPLMDRFKLNVPTLHLDTIGAGAGMILKVDPLTRKVSLGPESAGSDPGPICFAKGGTEPTIADCDAILGRLNPHYFLGGKVVLQVEKARKAFEEKCARVLGVGVEEAAEGMIEMLEADANNALRRVISGQGIHPSEFTLLSYGGSGPLHLAGCSRGIGFKDILTFQFAAAFSAFGCTTADFMRRHSVSTQIDIGARASDDELQAFGAKVTAVWNDLTRAAVDEMVADGHALDKVRTVPFLMMRYTGQLEDVEVMAPLSAIASADDMRRVIAEFEAVYAKVNHRVSRYGEAGFSITELGLIATADKVKPMLVKRPLGKPDPASAHKGVREAYIGGRWHKANLYEMDLLQPGHEVIGPAIIEHPATTLVVHPQDRVFVDEWTLLHYSHA